MCGGGGTRGVKWGGRVTCLVRVGGECGEQCRRRVNTVLIFRTHSRVFVGAALLGFFACKSERSLAAVPAARPPLHTIPVAKGGGGSGKVSPTTPYRAQTFFLPQDRRPYEGNGLGASKRKAGDVPESGSRVRAGDLLPHISVLLQGRLCCCQGSDCADLRL